MGVELAVGMGMLTAGTNLWASNQKRKAQKAQYDAEIKAAEANIGILEGNFDEYLTSANDAILEGQYQESIFQLEGRRTIGSQEASIAARGLALSGSSVQVVKDSLHNIMYDSNRIRLGALKESTKYNSAAADARKQIAYEKERIRMLQSGKDAAGSKMNQFADALGAVSGGLNTGASIYRLGL